MRSRGRTTVGIATLVALVAASGAQAASIAGDFDGDGRDDLAIGIQSEVAGGVPAGGVQVVYGGREGLSRRDRIITRATRGMKGVPGSDGFGSALASGRFDADGFDDLAVGVPFDEVPGANGQVTNGGSVHVLYGSRRGLTGRGDRILIQGRGGLDGPARDFAGFGWTLATGNLLGDRRDDLAVMTLNGQVGGVDNAGFVDVLRGSRRGLTTAGARRFSEATRGVFGAPDPEDRFGLALAVGDVAKSGHNDLAIGVPGQTIGGGATRAGAVHVLFGSRRGIRGRGSQYLHQEVLYEGAIGVDGTPEIDDFFGAALAIGRLDDRRKEDLAIGAPGEDITDESPTPTADSGLLSIVSGARDGVRVGANLVGGLTEPIASDTWTEGARFSYSLAVADVGDSRREDIIVGSPHSDGTQPSSGAVGIVYGGGKGYDAILQGVDGVEDFGGNGDLFGLAVGAGRFDGRGRADVAIGVPRESVLVDGAGRATRGGPVPIRTGAVAVLPGRPGGVSRGPDRLLRQGAGGLAGIPQEFDFFGAALSGPGSGPTSD